MELNTEVTGASQRFIPVHTPFDEPETTHGVPDVCVEGCDIRCQHTHLPPASYKADLDGIINVPADRAPHALYLNRLFRGWELHQNTLKERANQAERRARQSSGTDDIVELLKARFGADTAGISEESLLKLAATVSAAVVQGIAQAQSASAPSEPDGKKAKRDN